MNYEMQMDRVEAERHPCTYAIPARNKRGEPLACGAQVGERCRDPRTGLPLQHQAAHMVRLRDVAGVSS